MRTKFDVQHRFAVPLLAAGALQAVFWGGCAAEPIGGLSADKAAPATDVGRMQAWTDAERVAALLPGRTAVIGVGESMMPVYGAGTVLVITRIDYADLQPGMQVAYANDAGRQVVHVLVAYDSAKRGWRVRGLNNETEDSARVTPSNLIGVVYASFAPGEGLK